jgi:dTDP-4-dehydrorhamnose 3,5-epimerase
MGACKFIKTDIEDLFIIEPKVFKDERGYFMESYNQKEFEEAGLSLNFVQYNESFSIKNVLRGLHFQYKYPQGKLVRITKGCVYDVAVDIRKNSTTYGKSVGVILSADNKRQFYIPEGFAHGFLVLSECAQFLYKCTNYYCKEYEAGILWNDTDLNINWPIEDINNIILSKKDSNWPKLKDIK